MKSLSEKQFLKEPRKTNQYAYEISFFPAKEAVMHGLIDINSTEEKGK